MVDTNGALLRPKEPPKEPDEPSALGRRVFSGSWWSTSLQPQYFWTALQAATGIVLVALTIFLVFAALGTLGLEKRRDNLKVQVDDLEKEKHNLLAALSKGKTELEQIRQTLSTETLARTRAEAAKHEAEAEEAMAAGAVKVEREARNRAEKQKHQAEQLQLEAESARAAAVEAKKRADTLRAEMQADVRKLSASFENELWDIAFPGVLYRCRLSVVVPSDSLRSGEQIVAMRGFSDLIAYKIADDGVTEDAPRVLPGNSAQALFGIASAIFRVSDDLHRRGINVASVYFRNSTDVRKSPITFYLEPILAATRLAVFRRGKSQEFRNTATRLEARVRGIIDNLSRSASAYAGTKNPIDLELENGGLLAANHTFADIIMVRHFDDDDLIKLNLYSALNAQTAVLKAITFSLFPEFANKGVAALPFSDAAFRDNLATAISAGSTISVPPPPPTPPPALAPPPPP